MGSVKHLINNRKKAEQLGICDDLISSVVLLYEEPTNLSYGQGVWYVGGTFSVGDLKEQIPDRIIKNKPEGLTLMTALAFEYLANKCPDIPMCYLGVLDNNGEVVDASVLLDHGELSNLIVMQLAHVPETYSNGDLKKYREDLANGKLQCAVADIESIFRNGFPLGSSTFEKIFEAAGMGKEYKNLAKYEEVVAGLDKIRSSVKERGMDSYPALKQVLNNSGLDTIPNPGHILDKFVYNTTTKFESAGDRDLGKEEEKKLSGLSDEGYELWTEDYVPRISAAQIEFARNRNVINIDGKKECVSYHGMPELTDFICTPDENRLMILSNCNGIDLLIPTNKEIQRAIFRQEGVYAAIAEAKEVAKGKNDLDNWKKYMPDTLKTNNIDIAAVTEHSCKLMEYAFAEVANRILGKNVFETKPIESWLSDFIPYASRVQR